MKYFRCANAKIMAQRPDAYCHSQSIGLRFSFTYRPQYAG